jgi:hypothetical protein
LKWLVAMMAALLQVLLPAIVEAAKRKSEDARPQPELRDKLRRRVRESWGGALALLLALTLLGGCGSGTLSPRTIYVPDGEPVRLRETVKGAKVWVLDASGQPTPGVMDLPEGWYCLPVPEE